MLLFILVLILGATELFTAGAIDGGAGVVLFVTGAVLAGVAAGVVFALPENNLIGSPLAPVAYLLPSTSDHTDLLWALAII